MNSYANIPLNKKSSKHEIIALLSRQTYCPVILVTFMYLVYCTRSYSRQQYLALSKVIHMYIATELENQDFYNFCSLALLYRFKSKLVESNLDTFDRFIHYMSNILFKKGYMEAREIRKKIYVYEMLNPFSELCH